MNPRRPWCLPCRDGSGLLTWAEHFGIACPWHFGILSEPDQRALLVAVRRRHPRGGRVWTPIEQIVIVRMVLRSGDIPNTVEATWRRDARELAEAAAS